MQNQKPLLFFLIFISVFGSSLSGQTVTRKNGESTKTFVERFKPSNSQPVDKIVKTRAWSHKNEAIICFYQYQEMVDGETYPAIIGYLFWPLGRMKYHKIPIATFESDGGNPEIRSVFFDSVYGTTELIILCAWPQLLHYDYSGTYYSAYLFKPPQDPKVQSSLEQDKRWSSIFENQCDCASRDGKIEHARFTSSSKILAEIKRLTKPQPKT